MIIILLPQVGESWSDGVKLDMQAEDVAQNENEFKDEGNNGNRRGGRRGSEMAGG